MKFNQFDRLGLGIILVLAIFFLEWYLQLKSVTYLLVSLYIFRYSGSYKSLLLIGIASSAAIIVGYFLSANGMFSGNSAATHILSLSIVWLCVYTNDRSRREAIKSSAMIQSLSAQKDEAISELKSVSAELELISDERKSVEYELQKRKKLQEAMAHNFPDGVICVINKEMKFTLADGGEIEELGLLQNHRKNENSFLNLTALPEVRNAFNGEQVYTEIRVNNKSYSLNGVPIPDANDQVNEVLIVIRNITDQKNLENNLIKALEREKELNVLKSQFVTMASHKFRTPLSTILSSVFLLENYTDADYELEKTAFFDKIKRSVHNLTALLNDYLSLGKLEEGKLKVTYTETDINAFFDEFLQEIGSIKKVKQKIHFTHEGIDCTVMTDKFLLKNILTNLVSNAIEYSPHDAEIELAAELKKDTLKIRVTDQGIGIPENEQHQIFKRFYRGQNANNVEGTGLGLNIAKKYIRLLKGTIEFTSQLNKGTTFIAIIPVMNVNVLEKQA
jgi:signal transduction histidine kinase